jgi:hypothetical protein
MTRRYQEPGFGVFWHASARPGFQRGMERVAERIFRRRHIMRARSKKGYEPAVGISYHLFDRMMCIHGRFSTHQWNIRADLEHSAGHSRATRSPFER